jgi:hypothetical protein
MGDVGDGCVEVETHSVNAMEIGGIRYYVVRVAKLGFSTCK